MARLIDSKAVLRKMVGSNPPAMRVVDGFDLTTGRGTRIPQAALAQLLFGYRSVSDAVTPGGAVVSGRARNILASRLTPTKGYMYWGAVLIGKGGF